MLRRSGWRQTPERSFTMSTKEFNAQALRARKDLMPQGKRNRNRDNIGFLYILPWLVGFLFFKLYPFASSLYYSFTDMHLFNGISKYGLFNYIEVFTNRSTVKSLSVTFEYAL